MSKKKRVQNRRGYSDELKQEAVQMLLDGQFGVIRREPTEQRGSARVLPKLGAEP